MSQAIGPLMFAMSAVSAVSQISQGYAQKAESNYNATLLEGKANFIEEQKQIEYGQYNRQKGKNLAASYANMGAAGILPSGSAMAALLDSQTQINIDQSIGQFNLEQQKQYTLAEANQVRRAGKAAVTAGYTNAFSTLLGGASSFASYSGFGQRTSAGTLKNTTFDSVYKPSPLAYNQPRF